MIELHTVKAKTIIVSVAILTASMINSCLWKFMVELKKNNPKKIKIKAQTLAVSGLTINNVPTQNAIALSEP